MPIERITFWGIGAVPLFYVLAALSIAIFAAGVYLRISVWLSARGGHKLRVGPAGVAKLLADGLFGRRIFKGDLSAGLMHLLIMWGFAGLFVGTVLSTVDHWIVHYLTGQTYRVFSLCMEVFGLMLVAGLVLALIRRYVVRVKRLDNQPRDLWILVLLAAAVITGFFVEATRLAVESPTWESFSFGGLALSHLLSSAGEADAVYPYLWWLHAVICVGLVAYFPFSKLFHSLAAPVNIVVAGPAAARPAQAAGGLLESDETGTEDDQVAAAPHFSFADRLAFSACTRCGRCEQVCPSASAGEPFSPRDFIAQADVCTRVNFGSRAYAWVRAKLPWRRSAAADVVPAAAVAAPPGLSPEQIWYCTTCRACLEVCPVYVGAFQPIGRVRLAEIEDGSRVSPLLVNALETLYRFGNPWEPSKRKRGEWPAGLDVPDLTAGAEAVLCYWVGCTTSFDTRAQKLARAFVRILQHAGVPFGTLGQKETCCGDIARRVGESGLFEEGVEKTTGLLEKYGVTDLVTSSPHCFNLIKNEYPLVSGALASGAPARGGAPAQDGAAPDVGAPDDGDGEFHPPLRVRHYTQVLEQLAAEGRLSAIPGGRSASGPSPRVVTFHDPCYLGRYNGIYEAPRTVIRSLAGVRLVEMPRNRADSLCCGGGGGRLWQELEGEKKLGEVRVREAAATGADTLITACPYCLIMLEDAVKTADLEGTLRVMDLNELVAESLGLSSEEE
jgi:Fe-S oxidoreductase/nitrate reductase gamma subunit